jgi:hypothetical protein
MYLLRPNDKFFIISIFMATVLIMSIAVSFMIKQSVIEFGAIIHWIVFVWGISAAINAVWEHCVSRHTHMWKSVLCTIIVYGIISFIAGLGLAEIFNSKYNHMVSIKLFIPITIFIGLLCTIIIHPILFWNTFVRIFWFVPINIGQYVRNLGQMIDQIISWIIGAFTIALTISIVLLVLAQVLTPKQIIEEILRKLS